MDENASTTTTTTRMGTRTPHRQVIGFNPIVNCNATLKDQDHDRAIFATTTTTATNAPHNISPRSALRILLAQDRSCHINLVLKPPSPSPSPSLQEAGRDLNETLVSNNSDDGCCSNLASTLDYRCSSLFESLVSATDSMEAPPEPSAAICTIPYFLNSCGFCHRRLQQTQDIFIYRGDRAFCSSDCRQQQILRDERIGILQQDTTSAFIQRMNFSYLIRRSYVMGSKVAAV